MSDKSIRLVRKKNKKRSPTQGMLHNFLPVSSVSSILSVFQGPSSLFTKDNKRSRETGPPSCRSREARHFSVTFLSLSQSCFALNDGVRFFLLTHTPTAQPHAIFCERRYFPDKIFSQVNTKNEISKDEDPCFLKDQKIVLIHVSFSVLTFL